MKKWLVALLGIFMTMGSFLFVACDRDKANLSLSSETASIEIHSDEIGSDEIIITADVSGTSKYSLTATASDYEEFITVSTEKISSSRTNIIIKGESETDSPSVVTVSVSPGNIKKYIYVDVYSEVKSLTKKTDAISIKNNYLVKGASTTLISKNILNIYPEKARTNISWSINGTYQGASIENNVVTIDNTFTEKTIKLIPLSANGVTTSEPVELPVLDKIDEEISLAWSYSANQGFEEINKNNNTFQIAPNYDEGKEGFVVVNYTGDLEITGYALDKNGNITDDVVINSNGKDANELPLFRVSAAQGKTNLNGDYAIGFKIGYSKYNYAFDTIKENPINIQVREKINSIILSNKNSYNLEEYTKNEPLTLYTQYANSEKATIYGQEYNVAIAPTTVIGATYQYEIIVKIPAGGNIADECPVKFYYQDKANGNIWVEINMIEDGNGNYVVAGNAFPSTTSIYMKASNTLKTQEVNGVKIEFRSVDNNKVSTEIQCRLVKSVSQENFVFNDGNFLIDSSKNQGDVVEKKRFTLQGQNSIEGLSIINSKEYVEMSIQEISSDTSSVTFDVIATLKKSSYGMTVVDKYKIAHENGLVSDEMTIDIFLPLSDVEMRYSTGEDKENSVSDKAYNNKTYIISNNLANLDVKESSSTQQSLSRLMLKKDTTTPIYYNYNSVNGNSASAEVKVGFVDFSVLEAKGMSIGYFKSLQNSLDGIKEIVKLSFEDDSTLKTSGIAYFANDNSSIITKGVGYTYAVVYFVGKGVENVDAHGNITLARIILIESYVSPNGMNLVPDADKNVTLYSGESLATVDSELTREAIEIRFSNSNTTYHTYNNLSIISAKQKGSVQPSDTMTWTNGRYSLSNVAITSSGITFNIEALGTFGEPAFYDTLEVHYIITNDAGNKVEDLYLTISITIKNAQRVEKIEHKNAEKDGLYFEVDAPISTPQYVMLETTPTNARNSSISYVLTDKDGKYIEKNDDAFVSVDNQISTNVLALNLSNKIKTGMTGYIYILPSDAIFDNQIRYYYLDSDGKTEKQSIISVSMLGQIKDNTSGTTYYDFLMKEGYFKSNATDSDSNKNVYFKNILLKIKITVADGSSFEHSYRIFDNEGFTTMKPALYYTVMNSLDLTNETYIIPSNFYGGLQGANEDVTVKLAGQPFAGILEEGAQVRNIKFIGSVEGQGFVVNTNNGTITNVTIDTDGTSSSTLTVNGTYGGGIAGANNGTISYSNVLGLTISGTGTVGGIAGQNSGKIENSKVEFYNLSTGVNTFGVNTFTGTYVGAIVGSIENGSTIYRTFAYDYTLSVENQSNVLCGTSANGAFAGQVNGNSTIDYSFAVVNTKINFGSGTASNVTMTNYYIGYIDTINNVVKYEYSTYYESNPNFLNSGEEGFESYVNGENEYHLAGLMQDKKVASVSSYAVQKVVDLNGYYKSIPVSSTQGIIFNYDIKEGTNGFTSTEINDLNELNTISLSQLVGQENISKNIIITSSDINVLRVIGSDIKVMKTGSATLTLSSKHDVTNNKPITISVVYGMNNMQISWTNNVGTVRYVQDNSIVTLQKTRSRDFMVSYENSTVYLGATANQYTLKSNDINLNIVEDTTGNIDVSKINNETFKVTAKDNENKTNLTINPIVFTDAELQAAVNTAFARKFAIQPIDGVIDFGVSGQELPLTPSSNTVVKVQIKTTDVNDSVIPVISFNKETLTSYENANMIYYALNKDVNSPIEDSLFILQANIQKLSTTALPNDVYSIEFNVTFTVAEGYKSNIADNMDFTVYMLSESGNSSESWNGIFTLSLTRQNFTSIDIQTRKIINSHFEKINGKTVEVHEAGETIPVLAPGNSAIMQVNVNPAHAYYDYVEFSYSFGDTTVSDAVNVEVVEPNNTTNRFVRRVVDSRIDTFASNLRFTPTIEEKAKGVLYFKIWINTTVSKDSKIKFTATFKRANGTSEGLYINHVNAFLTISYLTQPTITIDGQNTAYLAKGSSAKIKIEVLEDQKVDSVTLSGNQVTGVNITGLSKEPTFDPIRGINVYEATLSATVMADTADSDLNKMFYIKAQVSRELNGSKEFKDSTATVILVDFKISENINITGTNENNLVVWKGVPKPFNVEYNLLPEVYNAASDKDSQDKVKKLNENKELFLAEGYYPSKKDAFGSRYLINYLYDENKNLKFIDADNDGERDENEEAVPETLEDRLFYVVGNEEIPISDDSVDKVVEFNYNKDTKSMSITGLELCEEGIQLVLHTYISAAGLSQTIKTYFTITVSTYSDPDLPISISDASEFNDLNPEGKTTIKQDDYILTNDIVLENYNSFDTSLIKSFDGNGYTIFIKSFDTQRTDVEILNLALFNKVVTHTIDGKEVPTTLKNIRVNIYNGGQITINTKQHKTINIAGLAIENSGVITNCEVVSFYTEETAMGEVISEFACTLHNKPTGFNVNYVYGTNTTENIYHNGNYEWNSQIAGFVLTNNGSITNSRVGGDSVIIVGNQEKIDGKPTGYSYASEKELDTFNIIGQGNVAGFVLSNESGYIASSFAKNIDIDNKSNTTKFYTAGFVGTNSSSIITSYIEGVESDEEAMQSGYNKYAHEGSSIKSSMGFIAGFIYENKGDIKDSYSNILIANSEDVNNVYLASGFVYKNEGNLENCYSASQILNSNFTQMNFSGVNSEGDLLTTGKYTNCYFFNKDYLDNESDTTTEGRYSTGATLVVSPNLMDNFYGFAIAGGENDGIWRVTEDEGPTLIEPNQISISNRYVYRVDEDFGGVTAEDDEGKYILLYSTLSFMSSSRKIDTSLGGQNNPILIFDAQDWLDVTGLSKSTVVQGYYNSVSIWGNYRLVNHIDLGDVAASDDSVKLPSSEKAFFGSLHGNGFEISGISIASDEKDNIAFGLFASIEKKGENTPIITNVNLKVDQIIAGDTAMVGALAGYIRESNIINIEISLKETSMVTGRNFVGTVAGVAFGNNIIKNIEVINPGVSAERYSVDLGDDIDDYFTSDELVEFRQILKNELNYLATNESALYREIKDRSYAGGVIGFVDNFVVDNEKFDINQKDNFSINNVRVNGVVRIQAQVVGGAFGLTSYQTNIRDVGVIVSGNMTVNSSYILSTKYFAGGVAGQSFGSINRTFAMHEESVQNTIEDNMSSYYGGNENAERGILNLFYKKDSNYTQKYIGGLVGYAGSGNIEISYSKLNVTSPQARFAGGIVGALDLVKTSSYKAENKSFSLSEFTKFYMNEVYATGDVRADIIADDDDEITDGYAGGIVGAIIGEGSRVVMLAVNAFNYFSTYDYETETYIPLNEDQTNVSINFKINAIVGKFIKADGTNFEVVISENGDPVGVNSNPDYRQFVFFAEAQDSSTIGSTAVPSVGIYENYEFSKFSTAVSMNLFPTTGHNSDQMPSRDILFKHQVIYVITGPGQYINSSIGYSYTQVGFLNSGAWSFSNWNHDMEDLFPKIKYKHMSTVLYLDCFNVDDIFAKMNNSNARVIVRGLKSKGAENVYDDIDLTQTKYKNLKIAGFRGRIEGGKYRVNTADSPNIGNAVKIISESSFISSVAAGFYVSNLTVEYTGTQAESESSKSIKISNESSNGAGLFVNGAISDATISGLTIQLKSEVIYETDGGDENVGLVATSIENTNITNLTIDTTISSGTAILSVKQKTQSASVVNAEASTLNVGLIAGKLDQKSAISVLNVDKIEIKTKSDLISVSETPQTDYYIGGYFGQIAKGANSQELRMTLTQIQKDMTGASYNDSPYTQISLNTSATNAYIGGYVGKAQLNKVSMKDDKAINNLVQFLVGQAISNSLYVGGIFGLSDSSSALIIDGKNSIFDNRLVLPSSTGSLYTGGLIGSIQTGDVSISGFGTVNFAVVHNNSSTETGILDKQEIFEDDYDAANLTWNTVNVTANVGIVVGEAISNFTFAGGSSDYTNLNAGKQVIRLKAGTTNSTLNFGSVLGYSETDSVRITGKIISKAQVHIEGVVNNGSGTTNFGGMVGNIEGTDPTIKIGYGETAVDSNSMLRFDGTYYSDIKTVVAGGIVGKFAPGETTSSLSIGKTSFGGAVKIYGSYNNGSSITFGGTLGHMATGGATVNILNNYNYGDVFAEYQGSMTTGPSPYIFGGVVGDLESDGNPDGSDNYDISNNYTLTTSHNAKQSSVNNRHVNAVFGRGVPEGSISANYYNHAVVLANDDNAVDYAYTTGQVSSYNGYKTNISGNPGNNGLADIIKSAVGVTADDYDHIKNNTNPNIKGQLTGHKLQPTSYDNSSNLGVAHTFNGMKYYTFSYHIGSSLKENDSNTGTDLSNIALIGDGTKITYNSSDSADTGLVRKLSGYSFISGVVVDANVKIENAAANESYGAIVGETTANGSYGAIVGETTTNSIIYAVHAQGKIEIGGSSAATVAGLVGNMAGGKLFDSSTDLDITYRAADRGNIVGIAAGCTANSLIENTYAAGSLKTMINAYVYAFNKGAAKVNNSYTITKLDLNNYTSSTNSVEAPIVFEGTTSKCYYDTDALNYDWGEDQNNNPLAPANNKTYTNLSTLTGDDAIFNKDSIDNGDWLVDYNFNYGYPTLKYGYLKRSSYATAGELEAEDGATYYDSYVKSREYIRLANGISPSDTEKTNKTKDGKTLFYMIPNSAVLKHMHSIAGTTTGEGANQVKTITGNFALLYDIDLNESNVGYDNSSMTFSGKFDGRDRTIKGLTKRFFDSITGEIDSETKEPTAEVRNLRLTDVSLSGNTGVLASTITNATISNMTLSGHITLDYSYSPEGGVTPTEEYYSSGSLACYTNGAKLDTITNMIDLKVTASPVSGAIVNGAASSRFNVGGLVGLARATTISYCSNYGPVTVNSKNASGNSFTVGGIVGNLCGYTYNNNEIDAYKLSTIEYSYNATSVLNNYATSSALSTNSGTFYTGGLAGAADGKILITNSYNSGMVKSGNKSNTDISYAGGILGYGNKIDNAQSFTISNCYNEGAIEALAKNPEFEWKWEKNENSSFSGKWSTQEGYVEGTDNNNLALTLRQTSETRNVYAYGIGFFKDINSFSYSVSDSQVKLAAEDYTDESIKNNGIYANGNILINSWSWENIRNSDQLSEQALTQKRGYKEVTWVIGGYKRQSFMKYQYRPQMPTEGPAPVVATSCDELGIPTAFILQVQIEIEVWNGGGYASKFRQSFKNLAFHNTNRVYGTITIAENFSEEYVTSFEDYYNTAISSTDGKFANIERGDLNSIGLTEMSDIKAATRSGQTDPGGTNARKVAIGGSNYYLADQNNLYKVFNAGVNERSGNIETDLQYFENKSVYSITAGEYDIRITDVTERENTGKANISYRILSEDPLSGDVDITVTADYSNSVTIDTSRMNYLYIDNYSIGIKNIEGLQYTSLSGYSLITAGGQEYKDGTPLGNEFISSDIIKLSDYKEGANYDENDKDIANYIYLVKPKDKNYYIFAPNAQLTGNIDFVNKMVIPEDLTGSIETVISNLTKTTVTNEDGSTAEVDKVYYSRYLSDDTEYVEAFDEMKIAVAGSGSGTINIGTTSSKIEVKAGDEVIGEFTYTGYSTNMINFSYKATKGTAVDVEVTFKKGDVLETTKIEHPSVGPHSTSCEWIGLSDSDNFNVSIKANSYQRYYITDEDKGEFSFVGKDSSENEYIFEGYIEDDTIKYSVWQFKNIEVKFLTTYNSAYQDDLDDEGYYKAIIAEETLYEEDKNYLVKHYYIQGNKVLTINYEEREDNEAQIKEIWKYYNDSGEPLTHSEPDGEGSATTVPGQLMTNGDGSNKTSFETNDYVFGQKEYYDVWETNRSESSNWSNHIPILFGGMLTNTAAQTGVIMVNESAGKDIIKTKQYKFEANQESFIDFNEVTYALATINYDNNNRIISIDKDIELLEEITNIEGENNAYENQNQPRTLNYILEERLGLQNITSVQRGKVVWLECKMPGYSPATKTVREDLTNFIVGYEGALINETGSTIEVVLADSKNMNRTIVTYEYYQNITKSENIDGSGTENVAEKSSIILTQDISFNDEVGFIKASTINIIGNNYYISYFGYSFYSAVNGTTDWIRDINFLGETYDETLFVSAGSHGTVTLSNISLYGSVTNISSKAALIDTNSENLTINNLTSYASIQSVDEQSEENDVSLTLVNNALSGTSENYGTITTRRGKDGKKGDNGSSGSKDGIDGNAGGTGVGITAASFGTMTNSGILRVGDGGNGGAGGSSYKGDDLSVSNTSNASGTAGDGGLVGDAGSLSGFDDNTGLSFTGKAGIAGAKARAGFGYFWFDNETDPFGEAHILRWYSYSKTYGSSNWGGSHDLKGKDEPVTTFNDVFKLEGDTYIQTFPDVDVFGTNMEYREDPAGSGVYKGISNASSSNVGVVNSKGEIAEW